MLRTLLLLALLGASAAQARLTIEITGGQEAALPIAIVPFGWGAPSPASEDVAAIVSADLARSGLFAPKAVNQMPSQPHQASEIDFASWRQTGIDNMAVGRVLPGDGGTLMVQFELMDVPRGTKLTGYNVPARPTQLRRAAHQIADLIYEKLIGQRGAFNTHVAYVTADKRPDGGRRFQLAVADADGYNEQIILASNEPLLSPAWSPEGKRLAYVSFEEGRSMVYVQNVLTGTREKVAAYPGLNSAPAWAPDGQRLALTLSKDGNPEIYIFELGSKRLTRVTDSLSIDTEPTWMPAGDAIVFTSDRGGQPQLYRVDVGQGRAGQPKRLTFDGSYNARGSVSPDGRRLAMVHRVNGNFTIAVMDLGNGNVRTLTETRQDESPSFAPNGSMIIYATEVGGRGVLEAAAVEGRAHQRLGLSRGDVREPAWSPYLND